MTAEVAILNKQSVALAADSAVTMGDAKIFNTVNKLFALSKHEPVGIMVYSSAELMGVPVETVIKEYRRSRRATKCDHLEEYAEDFEDFLKTDDSLFSEDARIKSLSQVACGLIWELGQNTLDKAPRGLGHPRPSELQNALSLALTEMEQRISAGATIQVAQPMKKKRSVADATDADLSKVIESLRKEIRVSTGKETRIRKMVINQFFHDVSFGDETGIVIAGFGTGDVFPRLRAFEFCYSALGLERIRTRRTIDISRDHVAQIMPFGQPDVMTIFMEGIAPIYRSALLSFIDTYSREKRKMLISATPPKTTQAAYLDSFAKELTQRLPKLLDDIAKEAFISPTMEIVASMPKEELAILAEAFINLTALKRKASTGQETVGGPTDVAVISKGDGFIWIKRKHYFDIKFNPTFAAARLHGGNNT